MRWRLVKETLSDLQPCGQFTAPIIMSLILSGSNLFNFFPVKGKPELLHLGVVPFQLFSPPNPNMNVWPPLWDAQLDTQGLVQSQMLGIQLKGCKPGTLLPSVLGHDMCAAFPEHQLEIPLYLLTPSSLSFGGRGRFQQLLSSCWSLLSEVSNCNPVFAKDLVPCKLCRCRGCDIWAGQGMLLGRRRRDCG